MQVLKKYLQPKERISEFDLHTSLSTHMCVCVHTRTHTGPSHWSIQSSGFLNLMFFAYSELHLSYSLSMYSIVCNLIFRQSFIYHLLSSASLWKEGRTSKRNGQEKIKIKFDLVKYAVARFFGGQLMHIQLSTFLPSLQRYQTRIKYLWMAWTLIGNYHVSLSVAFQDFISDNFFFCRLAFIKEY